MNVLLRVTAFTLILEIRIKTQAALNMDIVESAVKKDPEIIQHLLLFTGNFLLAQKIPFIICITVFENLLVENQTSEFFLSFTTT